MSKITAAPQRNPFPVSYGQTTQRSRRVIYCETWRNSLQTAFAHLTMARVRAKKAA